MVRSGVGMLQANEREKALSDALERFKQGRCPCCGKGIGESRGMELRAKSADLYCHTCKKAWPMELDMGVLEEELAWQEVILVDSLPVSLSESSIPNGGPQPGVVGRFGIFLYRIARNSHKRRW